jgi:hypothetical protein
MAARGAGRPRHAADLAPAASSTSVASARPQVHQPRDRVPRAAHRVRSSVFERLKRKISTAPSSGLPTSAAPTAAAPIRKSMERRRSSSPAQLSRCDAPPAHDVRHAERQPPPRRRLRRHPLQHGAHHHPHRDDDGDAEVVPRLQLLLRRRSARGQLLVQPANGHGVAWSAGIADLLVWRITHPSTHRAGKIPSRPTGISATAALSPAVRGTRPRPGRRIAARHHRRSHRSPITPPAPRRSPRRTPDPPPPERCGPPP